VAHRKGRDASDAQLSILANGVMTSLAAFLVAGSFLSQQYSEMLWHFVGLSTAIGLVAERADAGATVTAATTASGVKLSPVAAPLLGGRAFRSGRSR
jgi:hypothetical protein